MMLRSRRRPGPGPRTGRAPSIGYRLRTLAVVVVAAGAVAAAGLLPGAATAQARTLAPRDGTAGGTTCVAAGSGSTCTGTISGQNAWDWWLGGGTGGLNTTNRRPNNTGGQFAQPPTVTVDQTSGLTNQMVHVSWTNFVPTFVEKGALFHWPNQYSATNNQSMYAVSIFECKGTAPTDVLADCNNQFTNQGAVQGGAPPNAVESYTSGGTSTVYGDCSNVPTDTVCGTGSADIQVQTKVQNTVLGCDDLDPCSIVVVPNWGGLPATSTSQFSPNDPCLDHSRDLIGAGGFASNTTVGEFQSCAWDQYRIVVPLSFAKTPQQYCNSNDFQFASEGSPALEHAVDQWRPAWCTDTSNPLTFDYNSGVNEYEARNDFLSGNAALTSSTDVALVTDPASADQTAASARKFTYAPIATTGIAVAYYVDDTVTQQPITDLRLNARLLAKLLTESYTLQFDQCGGATVQSEFCDLGVQGNPPDIFADPEFLALNPQYTKTTFNEAQALIDGDFYPVVVAGNSDLTFELTRWIASDPEARAFLEGQPDQYGMHVNTYYKTGQSYPISQFQVLDPGFTVQNPNVGQYDIAMQNAWNPVTGLGDVAAHLAQWTSSALIFTASCSTPVPEPGCPLTNAKATPENFPTRTLFAIMDQGTAAAFRYPTAQLLNPAGKFVSPTTVSMSAAVASMQTNPDKITQFQDFGQTSPDAYPLTEVQYAMVPTCGLSTATAGAVSGFLTRVAGDPAQLYGTDVGELPPFGGYLALNDAQRAQTLAAAQAVSSQPCTSPPPDTTVSGGTPPPASGVGLAPVTPAANTSGGNGNPTNAAPGATNAPSATPGGSAATPSPGSGGQQPVGLGTKSGDSAGAAKTVLIVGLVLGGLLALGGPLTYAIGTGNLRLPSRRQPSRRRGPGTGGGD